MTQCLFTTLPRPSERLQTGRPRRSSPSREHALGRGPSVRFNPLEGLSRLGNDTPDVARACGLLAPSRGFAAHDAHRESDLHATRAEVSTTSSRTSISAARISATMVAVFSPRCAGEVEPIESARCTSVSTSIARRSITPKLSMRAKGESSRIASWRIQLGSRWWGPVLGS